MNNTKEITTTKPMMRPTITPAFDEFSFEFSLLLSLKEGEYWRLFFKR
jgi:hypothetical protein